MKCIGMNYESAKRVHMASRNCNSFIYGCLVAFELEVMSMCCTCGLEMFNC